MAKMKIKKGDKVCVVAGVGASSGKGGKGYEGKVLRVLPESNRIIVEGYHMITKHQKARGQAKPAGIIHQEAPVHASNVMVVCPGCGKPARLGVKVLDDKKKVRFCKKCGANVDK